VIKYPSMTEYFLKVGMYTCVEVCMSAQKRHCRKDVVARFDDRNISLLALIAFISLLQNWENI